MDSNEAALAPAGPRVGQRLRPRLGSLLLVLAVLFLLAAPQVVSRYGVFLLFTGLLYLALAYSWNLVGGYCGLVSLGHAAFLGAGAYTSTLLLIHLSLPLPLALLGGATAAAVLSVIVSPPLFRLRGIYFTVGTLALAEALRLWMIAWPVTGGAQGLTVPHEVVPDRVAMYYTALLVAAVAVAIVVLTVRSKIGMALRAIRDNEDAACNLGVSSRKAKLTALVLSSFIAGLVGAVWSVELGRVEPYSMFNLTWTILMVNMVIIGGSGTLGGPVVGVVFVVALSHYLADYASLQVLITGLLVIAVVLFAPGGVWGALRRAPGWGGRLLARARGGGD